MSLAARAFILLIRGYQRWISPLFGRHCRYEPSCSAYAAEAIGSHGAIRGTWMGMKRIARCHPWADGGFDPVPEARVPEHKVTERRVTKPPVTKQDSGSAA